jgi:hypothetical protein
MTGNYPAYDDKGEHWEDRRAHARITTLEDRLNSFETKLDANTAATILTATNTSELVSLVKSAKGLRASLLWWAPIGAFGLLVYSFFKDHWK